MIYVSNITAKQQPLRMPRMVFNRSSRVPIRKLEGRDHYVVPVVMLTVGVHNGSQGGLLYLDDPLQASVPLWNGKPVVVYHPALNRSAGTPEVFTKQRVGTVFNAYYRDQRLGAEAWIDVARIQEVDPQTADDIADGVKLEVSTGLFTKPNGAFGVHNGEEYAGVVTAIQPDHLALLPESVGACSIADGCGMGMAMSK